MALLYLIRHPATALDPAVPASEWRLSDDGHAQVRALAALPCWDSVAALYTSSQHKTTIVAEAIRAIWDIPCVIDADLDEARRAGWLGTESFLTAQKAFFADPDAPPAEDWEPASATQARFCAAMDRILTQHSAAVTVAVVAHATVLSLYVAHLRNEAATYDAWSQIGFAAIMVVDRADMQPVTLFISPPYDGL